MNTEMPCPELCGCGAPCSEPTHNHLEVGGELLHRCEVHWPTPEEQITKNDVIQISPDAEVNDALKGALAIVTDVRSWGVTANVPVPGQGVAPVRVPHGKYERIGELRWEE